jgi:hypothetical protein
MGKMPSLGVGHGGFAVKPMPTHLRAVGKHVFTSDLVVYTCRLQENMCLPATR